MSLLRSSACLRQDVRENLHISSKLDSFEFNTAVKEPVLSLSPNSVDVFLDKVAKLLKFEFSNDGGADFTVKTSAISVYAPVLITDLGLASKTVPCSVELGSKSSTVIFDYTLLQRSDG